MFHPKGNNYLRSFVGPDDHERIIGYTSMDFASSWRGIGRIILRWARELDTLPFSLPEGSRSVLDDELGSHGQVGDDGALVSGPQLGGISFHFSSEDSRWLEVDFRRVNPRKALFGLLSLWAVYMGGVDGGVGLRGMTGGMPISPFRALRLFALLCF